MIKSTFELESKLFQEGCELVVGVDEAGRGPLAGPVVAAAASPRNSQFVTGNLDKENPNYELLVANRNLIRDSKTLSHKQREKIFDFIHEHFYVGVGICDHKTIDRINILEASFLAMKKAVYELLRKFPHPPTPSPDGRGWSRLAGAGEGKKSNYIILLDGNKEIPNFSGEQKAVINGDKMIKSISAASIIAKVTRDRLMLACHEKYPRYCFDRHKGYGTKLHFAMLEKYGPCEIHRKSFRPVIKFTRSGNEDKENFKDFL